MFHSDVMPMSFLLKTKHGQGLQETPATRKHCNLITRCLCASQLFPLVISEFQTKGVGKYT